MPRLASPEISDELLYAISCVLTFVVSRRLDVTVRFPALPAVCDCSDRDADPPALVAPGARPPIPAVPLIASASPSSVLCDESTLTVWAVPLPTWIVMEPDRMSAASGTESSAPFAVEPAVAGKPLKLSGAKLVAVRPQLIVRAPAEPAVCELSIRRDWPFCVLMPAPAPMFAL